MNLLFSGAALMFLQIIESLFFGAIDRRALRSVVSELVFFILIRFFNPHLLTSVRYRLDTFISWLPLSRLSNNYRVHFVAVIVFRWIVFDRFPVSLGEQVEIVLYYVLVEVFLCVPRLYPWTRVTQKPQVLLLLLCVLRICSEFSLLCFL